MCTFVIMKTLQYIMYRGYKPILELQTQPQALDCLMPSITSATCFSPSLIFDKFY